MKFQPEPAVCHLCEHVCSNVMSCLIQDTKEFLTHVARNQNSIMFYVIMYVHIEYNQCTPYFATSGQKFTEVGQWWSPMDPFWPEADAASAVIVLKTYMEYIVLYVTDLW